MDEPLKPIGFWSYTSSDDTYSGGRLSQLRTLLAADLQQQVGRPKVHIWQDVAAIPHGSDWLKEIHKALGESSFLIPIVTPGFLASEMCCREVMRFRQRELVLGRDDLIFPFRYIDVTDIEPRECHDPAALALLNSRQWIDFEKPRYRDAQSEDVRMILGDLARSIRAALRRSVAPPAAADPTAPDRPERQSPETPPPPVVESVTHVGNTMISTGSFQMTSAAPVRPALPRPAIPPPQASPPRPVPGTVTRDPPGPELVLIPPGRFLMGIPEAETEREGTEIYDTEARPPHPVTIANPFWLGKYPVTRGEYKQFGEETGRLDRQWTAPGFPQDDRHPVVDVSFEDALAYIAWLNGKTGKPYRLPSEAEWEYAARAGAATARYWGEAPGKPGEHAHFGTTTGSCAVGSFAANGFGLFDMLGNVWEWTADPWHDNYNGAPDEGTVDDGTVWEIGGNSGRRVVRGGSWFDYPRDIRAGNRVGRDAGSRVFFLGFRVARTY